MLRWIKGQHFPPGFDEWCELADQSSDPRFSKHDNFSQFEKDKGNQGDWRAVAEMFIRSVTDQGKQWAAVNIDPTASLYHELRLEFPKEDPSKPMGIENTHILNLSIGGTFGRVECINLMARFCNLHGANDKCHVRLVDCVIGSLRIQGLSRQTGLGSRPILELEGCCIGTLILPPKSLWRLNVSQGGIAQIECPSSDGENPFAGAVSFKKVFFPSSPTQTKLFQGPHAYRSLYAHLKKLDNTLMANLMRSHQLRSERADEDWFSKVTNWFYGTFANYGMSPGRPLLALVGFYVLTVIYCYYVDQGTLIQRDEYYVGAYEALLDENGGRLTRPLLLPLHSIINPFGVFFDPRKLFVPTTGFGSILLAIQGLFSDILLVMTALSVRRRYKAE